MGTAAANRQAIWDREKAERKAPVAPEPLTPPKPRRTFSLGAASAWAVCKVFDAEGRLPIVVKARLTVQDAEVIAGRMRDGMSDEECGRAVEEGWNYKALRVSGRNAAKVANADDGAVKAAGKVPLRLPASEPKRRRR